MNSNMHKSFGATIDQLINISLFSETENGVDNSIHEVRLKIFHMLFH